MSRKSSLHKPIWRRLDIELWSSVLAPSCFAIRTNLVPPFCWCDENFLAQLSSATCAAQNSRFLNDMYSIFLTLNVSTHTISTLYMQNISMLSHYKFRFRWNSDWYFKLFPLNSTWPILQYRPRWRILNFSIPCSLLDPRHPPTM